VIFEDSSTLNIIKTVIMNVIKDQFTGIYCKIYEIFIVWIVYTVDTLNSLNVRDFKNEIQLKFVSNDFVNLNLLLISIIYYLNFAYAL